MTTLRQLAEKPESIPLATSWYLTDLGVAQGRQELFTKQSPQKLKVLREHALIESAISSNRIEGVTIDRSRIGTVVFGKSRLRDCDEEEVRGYRDALKLIHEKGSRLPVSEETVLRLHSPSHSGGDAGSYKYKDSDIIERYPDGRVRVRFKTVSAVQTPDFMRELVERWRDCLRERWVPPLIALGAWTDSHLSSRRPSDEAFRTPQVNDPRSLNAAAYCTTPLCNRIRLASLPLSRLDVRSGGV